jgi:hypothetical protein
MTGRKKTLWTCLGITAALLVVRLATSPVVFRVPFFTAEHSDQPRFVLLNPFRSRAPEEPGNQLVRSIEAGHCKEALASASDMQPEEKAEICAFVKHWFEYPSPHHWQLRNRIDSGDKCTLYYWHDDYPILWVVVRKVDGKWKFSWIWVIE